MARLIVPRGTVGYRENPPRGWHEQKDGQLVCPHRDLSVCPACAAANPEAVDVYGQHFWISTPAGRAELRAMGSARRRTAPRGHAASTHRHTHGAR